MVDFLVKFCNMLQLGNIRHLLLGPGAVTCYDEKMETLPADIELRIKAQVASGAFASEDEVLRQAMDVLERRQNSLNELREMVQEADADIAAGQVGEFDVEHTMQVIQQRLAESQHSE